MVVCYFSPHTDNINMSGVTLYPGEVTKLHQLVSLSQSWIVNWLQLHDLGPEDWTELSRSLDTLDSVSWVEMRSCSAPPSVSLLETLWNKTQERWEMGDLGKDKYKYYKKNEEDFSKLRMKYFQ